MCGLGGAVGLIRDPCYSPPYLHFRATTIKLLWHQHQKCQPPPMKKSWCPRRHQKCEEKNLVSLKKLLAIIDTKMWTTENQRKPLCPRKVPFSLYYWLQQVLQGWVGYLITAHHPRVLLCLPLPFLLFLSFLLTTTTKCDVKNLPCYYFLFLWWVRWREVGWLIRSPQIRELGSLTPLHSEVYIIIYIPVLCHNILKPCCTMSCDAMPILCYALSGCAISYFPYRIEHCNTPFTKIERTWLIS